MRKTNLLFSRKTDSRPRPVILILFLIALYSIPSVALSRSKDDSNQWRWSGVARIVVIADVHGAFAAMTGLLKESGVINESLQWIAGETHLVSLGDLLDRGSESRKVMDLLMRLRNEARAQGGHVHVVAGNHEIMNLMGDLRYVSPAEFAEFAADEPAGERDRAYTDFLTRRGESIALSFLRSGAGTTGRNAKAEQAFAALYPPGYFGHQQGFSPAGRYGRWLLSLPAMIVINQTVYVHGGLPAVTATATLQELNQRYQAAIRRYLQLWRELIAAGVLVENSVEDIRLLATQALRIADPRSCAKEERIACGRERGGATNQQRTLSAATLAVLKEFVALGDSPMLGPDGPLWYRGSVRCKDILERPILDAALENLGAKRVVVGHTPTTDRRVHSIRDQRLIMLDTGMLVSRYQGRPAALLIENNELNVQYLNPSERIAPQEEGGNGVYPLSASQLREALETGAVVDVNKRWLGQSWQVELAHEGAAIQATFYPNNKRNSANLELAAFELDRELGFGLVPMTVARQINGEQGALQLGYPDEVTAADVQRRGIEPGGWCPIKPQYDLLNVFDLLVDNTGRSKATVIYDTQHWGLHVTAHGNAFGHRQKIRDLPEGVLKLPPAVEDSLRRLNKQKLASALGRWLDEQQIAAIVARRDALLTRYVARR